jgi:hypothetical protein
MVIGGHPNATAYRQTADRLPATAFMRHRTAYPTEPVGDPAAVRELRV